MVFVRATWVPPVSFRVTVMPEPLKTTSLNVAVMFISSPNLKLPSAVVDENFVTDGRAVSE